MIQSTPMTANELRQKYIDFFVSRGHKHIPSASLVPENDPTTLFTSSGMQPLVPYLLGEKHPQGTRLVDSQKSFRSQDIEEVGDNRHTTFFEMLGNWSLGDYFKKDQLTWFFNLLTQDLNLNPQNIYVTVFSGDPKTGVPRDDEAIKIWQQLFDSVGIDANYIELGTETAGYKKGMSNGRIFGYGVKKNWWSRSGVPANMPKGEPGGPDSEVFYDFNAEHSTNWGEHCHPNCDCGRFLEIGNSVFMQYQKQEDGSLKELPNKNVDFGGGLERILAAVGNDPDVFNTDLFIPIIKHIEKLSNNSYKDNNFTNSFRVIADHLKAATMLAADGVFPSNKAQGYFSRRLIRRAIRHGNLLGIDQNFTADIVPIVTQIYQDIYPEVSKQSSKIIEAFEQEENKFRKTLNKGLKQFEKLVNNTLTAKQAFFLFETYGFPLELSIEEAQDRGVKIESNIEQKFADSKSKHAQASRTASAGMFKGGLADHSEQVTKLHTATHLLHAALRNILGDHVTQQGSNITAERLRFDFTHPQPLTKDEIKQIQDQINQQIEKDLKVTKTIEDKDQALASGAMAFFREKYADKVSVYTIGDPQKFYSKELCGGPHVTSTGEIGTVTIKKQQSIGAGKRRLYAEIS